MKMLRITTLLAFSLSMFHCTGELPLSDLINNTISLKVMGTYESNDSYPDNTRDLALDDVITTGGVTGSSPTIGSSDLTAYAANATTGLYKKPSTIKYYIDLAEIRMASGQGKSSSQSISDYWLQFAIDRQLMCSDYNTADPGLTLSNCAAANGIERLSAFFNGGFNYPAVDVPSGNFNHLGIYFRRFVTSGGARFKSDGTFLDGGESASTQAVSAAFDNRTIYGFDVEGFLQNNYGATNTEPLMFPLQRKDLALSIGGDYTPYVLEVRVFVKNAMMVHVLQGTISDGSNASFIYVAPSDWNVDHAFKDSLNGGRQGGSLLMTARVYQPSNVGSIAITGGAATAGEYFAVVPEGQTFANPYVTTLPLAATRGTNTTITNLAPGRYDVYRTCDKRRCTTASTAGSCDNNTSGTDNFPETADKCGTVPVTAGTTSQIAICSVNCP